MSTVVQAKAGAVPVPSAVEPEALADLIADATALHARLHPQEQLDLSHGACATAVICIPQQTLSLVDGFAEYGS